VSIISVELGLSRWVHFAHHLLHNRKEAVNSDQLRCLEANFSRLQSVTRIMSLILNVFHRTSEQQGKVRHRQLPACTKRGRPCDLNDDNCCGAAICFQAGAVPLCCLPVGTNGCDDDSDCCDPVLNLVCDDSVCVVDGTSTTISTETPRPVRPIEFAAMNANCH